MFCIECGNQLKIGIAFCGHCGEDVAFYTMQTSTPAAPIPTPQEPAPITPDPPESAPYIPTPQESTLHLMTPPPMPPPPPEPSPHFACPPQPAQYIPIPQEPTLPIWASPQETSPSYETQNPAPKSNTKMLTVVVFAVILFIASFAVVWFLFLQGDDESQMQENIGQIAEPGSDLYTKPESDTYADADIIDEEIHDEHIEEGEVDVSLEPEPDPNPDQDPTPELEHEAEPEQEFWPEHVLGASSSSIQTASALRIHNIALAADMINDTVLQPGDVFSYNNTVGPWTVERGFVRAEGMLGGVPLEAVGSGVAQLASNIFDAVLDAGLEVIERHQHQEFVEFMPLGREARVVHGRYDLRFRNNTGYPIRFEILVSNDYVTVNLVRVT